MMATAPQSTTQKAEPGTWFYIRVQYAAGPRTFRFATYDDRQAFMRENNVRYFEYETSNEYLPELS